MVLLLGLIEICANFVFLLVGFANQSLSKYKND